jgi:Mrp family chromosome partitioning ATPase
MIEPINFFGGLRRGWRLVVVLAVIGAVVALLMPISPVKHKKSILRWAPSSAGILQGTVNNDQILFYSNTLLVKIAAVADANQGANLYVIAGGMFGSTTGAVVNGVPSSSVGQAPVAGSSKKGGGSVTLHAAGQTPAQAAVLANFYAKELGIAIEAQAATRAALNAPTTKGTPTTVPATPTNSSPFAPLPIGYQVLLPGTTQLAHRINVPSASALDSHKVRLVLGVLAGLLLAMIAILVREVLDTSLRRVQRAQLHFKFPVIGEIPATYPPDPNVVDVVDRPTSMASEAYRKLRMSVLFEALSADAAPPSSANDAFGDLFGMGISQLEPYKVPDAGSRGVILIASTADELSRGKVAANLAAAYAEAWERVIVISTSDLEAGTAYPTELVLSRPIMPADIDCRITPAGPENVSMLSMRHFMRNSGQLVNRAHEVFDAARQVADVVIVETPAFLRFHHAEALVHSVDAVVIVADFGDTEASDAKEMGGILRRLGAPVLGVVFSGVPLSKRQCRAIDATPTSAPSGTDAPEALAATEDGTDPVGASLGTTPEFHPS